MRRLIATTALALSLAACQNDGPVAESSPAPAGQMAAAQQQGSLTPEQLGELGARIRKSPNDAERLLAQHNLTAESFEAQIRAVTESIRRELKACGTTKLGQEGSEGGQWVLLDYSDCVIHVFSPELREYYGLESLWGDAPRLDWAEEAAPQLQRLAPTGT